MDPEMRKQPSQAELDQAMAYLKQQMDNMPEEDRLKLLSQLSAEEQKILLPGGKASLGKDGLKKEEKGIEITPSPGFTLKTKDIQTGKKVFINVCTHEDLDIPGIKKRLNDKGEEVEGYNVPMSVGPARNCADKAGVDCTVYDMIVNPKVIEEIKEDLTGKQRDFICQLGMQCVENKYSIEVDKRYKLPNLTYIGEKASQWIKDRKTSPKIEEVSSSAPKITKGPTKKKAVDKVAPAPVAFVPENLKELPVKCVWLRKHYAMSTVGEDSSIITSPEYLPSTSYVDPVQILPPDVEHYVMVVDPLSLVSENSSDSIDISKQIKLQCSPFKIQIRIVGYKPLNYYFPCAILPQNMASCLTKGLGATTKSLKLYIRCPLDHRCELQLPETHPHYNIVRHHTTQNWDSLVNGDPGSRLWLVANALQNESDSEKHNPYSRELGSVKAASTEVLTGFEDQFVVYSDTAVSRNASSSQSTGSVAPLGVMSRRAEIDDEILPEDRFHSKDAASQYIIGQREQAILDKKEKHEQERKNRENDPDVEYVEPEDFKPGGKYAPKSDRPVSEYEQELSKGASTISSTVSDSSNEVKDEAPGIANLTSTLWSELL